MLDCVDCVAKYVLCWFNFFFFLGGSVVLGIGIWLAVDKHSFISTTQLINNPELQLKFQQFTQPSAIDQVSYILIAAGIFVFVVSFLGYCGAVRESRCLLIGYVICLIIILIMEIVAGGLAIAYKDKAEVETRGFLKSTIGNYYSTSDKADGVTLMWDYLMAQMHCCGVDDYKDFQMSSKWTDGKKKVPDACCVLVGDIAKFQPKDGNCPFTPSDSNSYWKTGCYRTFIDMVMEHANMAIWVGVGLGLSQLIGLLLACCLYRALNPRIK